MTGPIYTKPRHLPSVLLSLFLVAWLAPAEAHAAKKKKKEKSVVSGVVTDQNGTLLADVAVTVSASSADFSDQATTDKKGEFEIEVPTGGEVLLRLAKDGYAPRQETMTLTPGEQQLVQIQMLDASATRRNQAVHAYNAGAEAYEAEDYETAKEQFIAAIEADASVPEPYLVLADIHLIDGAPEEAAAAAEKYLALVPGDQKGQMLAYEAYQKLGNEERVAELRAVLGTGEMAPKLAIQVFNEGALANQEGDLETAIAKFRTALDFNPELGEAHAALAAIYYNQEQYQEALEAVGKAIEAKPDHVVAHRVRFLIHDALGNRAEAQEAMASYVELDKEGAAGLLYQRADLDFRDGQPELAKAGLLKVLELSPDMPRAHYTLGLVYASTDTAKAKAHLLKFIELAPDDPEVETAREMLSAF